MNSLSQPTKNVCIECGTEVESLFKKYDGGFVELSHCRVCESLVDKYVEYDWVLISLDALLHKTQAYRHIIYNSDIQSHAKLCMLFLLFDAYSKWTQLKIHSQAEQEDIFIFYAAMEMSFYKIFLLSCCGTIAMIRFVSAELSAALSTLLIALIFLGQARFVFVVKGLLLSNMGKVFLVPAVIWGHSDTALYLGLVRLLQFTSNAQALKVLIPLNWLWAAVLSAVMFGAEYGCRLALGDLLF